MAQNHEPFLTMRNITKRFPGVLANDHMDLDIFNGEIHALLGENGAGKSTLMKILYGFYRADSGEIKLRGLPVKISSPHDARRLGIGMVFQNFTLIPALTVLDNITLFLPQLSAHINKALIIKKIEEVSERYGFSINPMALVSSLSVGEQQKVEIIKLLLAKAQILIFDEPTKVLAPHEIDGLLKTFADLRNDGYAVVFITHKLQEVLACTDRITVLRRGALAGTISRGNASEEDLLSMMFDSLPVEPKLQPKTSPPNIQPLMELKQVSTKTDGGNCCLHGMDLQLMPGEIVGVAGVSGNGQRELGDVILGLGKCVQGNKYLFGMEASHWSVGRILANGVAFIPEDPLMTAVPGMSILENMTLGATKSYELRRGWSMDWKSVERDTEKSLKRLSLKLAEVRAPVRTLSGGNFQRIILARELARQPRIIIAFYPTRSLDVPGAVMARELLVSARNADAGVLLISEDLNELFSYSDRMIVLHQGSIVGHFRPEETSVLEVGHLMTGYGRSNANNAVD